jgi:hypothetical protein
MEVCTIPKYPDITVPLTGTDGNVFAVLGKVSRALRQAGVSQAERDAFTQEETASDYDRLLQTVMRWVEVD